jgi:hypothetical protein
MARLRAVCSRSLKSSISKGLRCQKCVPVLVARPWLIPLADAQHRFVPEEDDWGFARFSEHKELYQPHNGYSRPLVEDDRVEVTAFVRVLKDPTGVLWHSFKK